MKIFGHRGAAGLMAENTLQSISKALELRSDGVEVDVYCCKTGELVVIHDDTVDRTTNGSGKVQDLMLSELKELIVEGSYVIPTLTEVLDLIDGRCQLNIELKGKATANPVISLVQKYLKNPSWKKENFIISSFDHEQLYEVKSISSYLKIGVLTDGTITEVLRTAKNLNAYSIHPSVLKLNVEEVHLAQNEGFEIYVWTVNEIEDIKRLSALNVEAVITDFPNFVI